MLKTRWPGYGPWDEVWFLEAHLPGGESLWLRYTLSDAVRREVRLWAVWYGRSVTAASTPAPLAPPGGALLVHPDGVLSATHDGATATGACGPLRWDLSLSPRGPGHDLVPPSIGELGRAYRSEMTDLLLHGTLETPDGPRRVDGARGVLGHIHGRRNRAHTWAWAHAVFPGRPDVVFEGLSARLGVAGLVTPPLTSLRVAVDGQSWSWSSPLDLLLTRSQLGPGGWAFETRSSGARLSGVLTPGPPERSACLRYTDERGRPLWCRNSPESHLRLTLERPGLPPLRLESDRVSGELASRLRPPVREDA